MDFERRLSLLIKVFYIQAIHFKNQYTFSNNGYSVVSMPSSVIFFGGYDDASSESHVSDHSLNIVAEYRDGRWNQLGRMTQFISKHQSIQINEKIFIYGNYGSGLGNDQDPQNNVFSE